METGADYTVPQLQVKNLHSTRLVITLTLRSGSKSLEKSLECGSQIIEIS